MAKYSCKNCGAELFFDPKSGKLHCDYCGSDFDPSEYAYVPETDQAKGAAKDKTVKQGLSEDEINKAKQDGMSEQQAQAAAGGEKATDDSTGDLVVYKCPNCGAEVITSKDTAATTCVYCNRAITLEGNISGQFRPDYVVPFTRTQDEVEAAYHKLCRSSILTPKAFSDKKNIKKIKGMLHGVQGLMEGRYIDLSEHIKTGLDAELLKRTPASYLGSCRYKLPEIHENQELYEKIFEILHKLEIDCFIYIGGNDSMQLLLPAEWEPAAYPAAPKSRSTKKRNGSTSAASISRKVITFPLTAPQARSISATSSPLRQM